MPEIGYWKYVRFTDDEPLWFGTDDDITVVFDSADDRLEFRMKKDIRFEDDVGNEILTLDKVNRHVEIPVQLNVAALEEYVAGAGITVKGTLTFSGADLDLAGNLLKNTKLGSHMDTNGYSIIGKAGDAASLGVGAGSSGWHNTGGAVALYGINHPSYPGMAKLEGGAGAGGIVRIGTYNAALTSNLARIIVNIGDTPDIELQNCILNFSTGYPALETGKAATGEFLKIEVGGVTKFLALYA